MKVGVFICIFGKKSFEGVLDFVTNAGVEAVEIPTGGYIGKTFFDPAKILDNEDEIRKIKNAIEDRNLIISSLSCHGNMLHPQQSIAKKHMQDFHNSILLAEKLEVDCVVNFSGCPGDPSGSKYPNWVISVWPDDYGEILKWQWEEKIIPFWKENADFAEKHGVKIGIEAHPGFAVYNTRTLLKLRNEVGKVVGANFDPSHLFWQGIDPVKSIRKLGDAIFHVHAKDVEIDPINSPVNGVIDTTSYSDVANRSWSFRSVGYGHDYLTWKNMISALRLVGYRGVLSIEHEDRLASIEEGVEKAINFLKEVVLKEEDRSKFWGVSD
jgi:sugar phosphate isomerase/epimerase